RPRPASCSSRPSRPRCATPRSPRSWSRSSRRSRSTTTCRTSTRTPSCPTTSSYGREGPSARRLLRCRRRSGRRPLLHDALDLAGDVRALDVVEAPRARVLDLVDVVEREVRVLLEGVRDREPDHELAVLDVAGVRGGGEDPVDRVLLAVAE